MILTLNNKIDDFDKIDISITYNKGGINYFNYKDEKRGYYLHFSPCKIIDYGNNCIGKQTQPFHKRSWKLLICPVNRKSDKKLAQLNDILDRYANDILEDYEESDTKCAQTVLHLFKNFL